MSFPAADWVAHHAEVRPHAVALGCAETGETVTWQQLESRVGHLAAALRLVVGAGPGDRIALIADNHPRVFELQFACMRSGVVLVPLNWRLAIEEIRLQCADADVAAIVHDTVWTATAHEISAACGVDRLANFEELSRSPVAPMAAGLPDPDSVTHILYTSGTTGRPKGALVTHATMMWNAFNIVGATQVAAPDVHMLNPMPLFHAGGLNVLANPILMFGGQVTTMRRWDPPAVVRYLSDPAHRITHITTAPPLLQMLVDTAEWDEAELTGVREVVVGGGLAGPELIQAFADKGVSLRPQYGGTETGPAALVLEEDVLRAPAGTCGKPVLHTMVRLVDPLTLADVDIGEVGEIWLAGASVTPGYWNLPGEDFFVDGWYRTGDAARRDKDGYYYISGRLKDMYKSGGENVYAAEVEIVLLRLESVAEVAVVGIPDPKWGEVGLAVVVPVPGATVTLADLHSACEGRLARYKFPRRVEIADALPRNVTGKVAKMSLRERYA